MKRTNRQILQGIIDWFAERVGCRHEHERRLRSKDLKGYTLPPGKYVICSRCLRVRPVKVRAVKQKNEETL